MSDKLSPEQKILVMLGVLRAHGEVTEVALTLERFCILVLGEEILLERHVGGAEVLEKLRGTLWRREDLLLDGMTSTLRQIAPTTLKSCRAIGMVVHLNWREGST